MRRSVAGVCFVGVSLLVAACGSNPLAPEVLARPPETDPARIRVVIPEVYELANVIVAMTSFGQSSPVAVNRTGAYYQRVNTAFSAFRNHASMRDLQFGSSDPLLHYYEFRDNSFAYVFEDGEIRRNPAASTSWSENLFRERRAAAQTFAEASQFRGFFAANEEFYADVIARYRAMAEIDAIADWLEREFPGVSYRHYTVVLSPLVYGSHSAQFPSSNEALFFVSGPDVTTGAGTSDGVKKATVQRILFTEIDHAFVNPTTDRYRTAINSAFGNRAKWTTDGSGFYDSPTAVFNEYMTWAAFLVFVQDRLSAADFDTVRQLTVQQMEGSRRFQRFGAFTAELLQLYAKRTPGATVASLYPQIIAWSSSN
jgi:Domain of unknown function (DUF4932)